MFLGSWPPSIFKDKQLERSSLASLVTSPSLTQTLLPSSFIYKHTGITLGPPAWSRIISPFLQLISNLSSIYNLNSLFPCSLSYSQIPGMRKDVVIFRGLLFCLPHVSSWLQRPAGDMQQKKVSHERCSWSTLSSWWEKLFQLKESRNSSQRPYRNQSRNIFKGALYVKDFGILNASWHMSATFHIRWPGRFTRKQLISVREWSTMAPSGMIPPDSWNPAVYVAAAGQASPPGTLSLSRIHRWLSYMVPAGKLGTQRNVNSGISIKGSVRDLEMAAWPCDPLVQSVATMWVAYQCLHLHCIVRSDFTSIFM